MAREQIKVLIVDDEEAVRSLLQRVLEEVGYSVFTAANGQEALDRVLQIRVEVVLLDIKMPGMSSHSISSSVRALARSRSMPWSCAK